eukprot:TRINITY_DN5886_c0_g1_i13.p1 TRINITY_DN5886_c0_g1~~TRINITY_DN5886_c0_g1_i13.p1  ORF type:complete len:208 (-),score=36.76 TRINITY_DN5886_c0_g1_i13:765-1388(-)
MGCINSAPKSDQTKIIDQQIKQAKKEDTKVQVLFLGTGESGKSTFLKQIIFLTKDGDVKDDFRLQTKNIGAMKENLLHGMCELIRKATEDDLLPKECSKAIDVVQRAEDIGPEEGEALKFLWMQDGIQHVWKEQLVRVPPFLDYFLERVDQIPDPQYKLTCDEILRVRQKTTGIQWYDIPPKVCYSPTRNLSWRKLFCQVKILSLNF